MFVLLEILHEVVQYVLKLVLDIVALCAFLVSLVAFWRWPSVLGAIGRLLERPYPASGRSRISRGELRRAAVACFLHAAIDIAVAPLLAACLMSWRLLFTISLVRAACADPLNAQSFSLGVPEVEYNMSARVSIVIAFALLLLDAVQIPMLLFVLAGAVWRMPVLLRDCLSQYQQHGAALLPWTVRRSSTPPYMPSLTGTHGRGFRSIVWSHFGHGVIDVLLLPFALVILLSAYRVPRTWRLLFPDGFSLTAATAAPPPPPPSSPNARRIPVYATLDEAELAEARRYTTMQRKALIFLQAARVVFDALACIGTAFVFVTLLQAPALVSDLGHYWRWSALPPHLRERAAAPTAVLAHRNAVVEGQVFVARMNRFWWSRVAYHVCLVPLNAVFGLPPLLIVVCTLYRLFFFLRDVRERTQRWAPSLQPAVRVTSYTVEAPKEGRNGIVIRVRGTKAPDFTLGANGEQPEVALYVRNMSFWRDGIQPALGQMQSSIGQALLPLHLVPTYWPNPAQQLQVGETECELEFDFSSAPASTSCIMRNAKRAGMTPLVLQVEYSRTPLGWARSLTSALWGSGVDPLWPNDVRGAHAAPTQTLLCLSMPDVSQLESVVKQGTVMVPDDGAVAREWQTVTIAPYYQVWALVALRQAGLVIWDLAAVVLFVLLHLFPHRVRVVYQSAFEGPQRRAARRVVKEMRWARELISRATGETERCVAELDRATREGVLAEPLTLTPEFVRAGTRQMQNLQILQSYASLLPAHAGAAHRIAQQLYRASETAVRAFVLSLIVAFPRPVITGHTRFPSQVTPHASHDDLSLGEETTDEETLASSGAARTDSLRWREPSRTGSHAASAQLQGGGDSGDASSSSDDDDWRPPPALTASNSEAIARRRRSAGDSAESAPLSMTGTPNMAVAHADEDSVVDPILDAVFERSSRVSHFPLPDPAAANESQPDSRRFSLPPDVNVAAESAAVELLRAADAAHAADRPSFYIEHVRTSAAAALAQLRALDAQSDRVIAEAGRAIDTRGDGWIGFRTRVTEQVLETAYDLAAVAVCLALTVTLYRAPWLWRRLLRSANPRRQCIAALGELLLDLEFILKAGIVVLCVRGALDLPMDLAIWLPRYPSFRVARGVVQHHYRRALENLIEVVRLVFTGRALKFILATAAFALLAPAVMFESWLPAARRTRFAVVVLLVATLAWMFALPAQVARHYHAEAPLVYWAPMLTFVALGNVLAVVRRDPHVLELRRAVVRHARPTWHNAGPFVLSAAELLQLAAVGLMAVPGAVAHLRSGDDSVASLGGFTLRMARAILLLDCNVALPTRFGGGVAPLGPVFAVTAMGVYFFGAAMPVVTWHILGWRSGRLLPSSTAWIAFMQLFGPGVQTIVALHLAGLLRCDAGVALLYGPEFSSACWAAGSLHSRLAFAGMVLGVFYFPTVLTRNAMYDESTAVALDVVIAQLYRMLTGVAAVTAAVIVGGFPSLSFTGLGTSIAVLCAAIWSLLVSLLYGRVLNRTEGSFTTFPALAAAKIALYAALIPVAVVFCVATASGGAELTGVQSGAVWAATTSLATGALGLLLAAATAGAYAKGLFRYGRVGEPTHHAQATIDVARQQLLALEEGLHVRGMLNGTWGPQRAAWRRRCAGALRDSTLAVAAVELERCVVAPALNAVYVRARPVWVAHADTLTDDVDRGVVEMDVNGLVNFGRGTGRRNGFLARLIGTDGTRPTTTAATRQRDDEHERRRRGRRHVRRAPHEDESATEEELEPEAELERPHGAADYHHPGEEVSRFRPEMEASRAETLLRLVQGLCNGAAHPDVERSLAVSRLLTGDVTVAVTSLHRPLPLR